MGGRWWSIDPIVKPWESPYAGYANNPIFYSDPSGLDPGGTQPGDTYNPRTFTEKEANKGKVDVCAGDYIDDIQYSMDRAVVDRKRTNNGLISPGGFFNGFNDATQSWSHLKCVRK